MDFENTLSTAADTSETGDAAPAADTSDTPEPGSQVIVMQSETSTPSTTRSVSLDAPAVDAAGLPAVVKSVFGEYHQRTQTVT